MNRAILLILSAATTVLAALRAFASGADRNMDRASARAALAKNAARAIVSFIEFWATAMSGLRRATGL